MRQRKSKLIILVVSFSLFLLFSNQLKISLQYNKYHNNKRKLRNLDLHGTYYNTHCPNYHCTITEDRSVLYDANAVVFMMNTFQWADIPLIRQSSQRYVLLGTECPGFRPRIYGFEPDQSNYSQILHFFNWTMLYTSDTDILIPFGFFIPVDKSNIDDRYYCLDYKKQDIVKLCEAELNAKIDRKRNLAAWQVSNCGTISQRERLVYAMRQTSAKIDIYGNCTEVRCGEDCNNFFDEDYYFYLSLENAICPEYITEKVYERVKSLIVPIVLSREIAQAILPPMSFVAVDDFETPKDLVDYLKYLQKNRTAYLEYFKWRRKSYTSFMDPFNSRMPHLGICSLCEKLHEDHPEKSYADMASWWKAKKCQWEITLKKWRWKDVPRNTNLFQ